MQRSCTRCTQERAKPVVQLMGSLPESRLAAGTLLFSRLACDNFGPLETSSGRNRVAKRWGALFTCLVTRVVRVIRAVYLDIASSLSSDDFVLMFRRLIGLYGKPTTVHSDNGTGVLGAERELREAVRQLNRSEEVEAFCRRQVIEWKFQPAYTPHFGGAHESLVRSTKRALYAALDEEKKALRYPTDDMLQTLLFEVAGLLKGTPLTYASSDPNDFRPLTPNDFLNRPPAADLPSGDFDRALPREHYRYVQRRANLFWDMWKRMYLQSLAEQMKWKRSEQNLEVGDLVAETHPQLRHGQWRTGLVVTVYPGSDGPVRAIDFKTSEEIFRRGIRQLCLIEPGSSGDPPPYSGKDGGTEETPATA